MSMVVPDIYHVALGTSLQDLDVIQPIDFCSLSLPHRFPASHYCSCCNLNGFFYFLYINAIIHILLLFFPCLN